MQVPVVLVDLLILGSQYCLYCNTALLKLFICQSLSVFSCIICTDMRLFVSACFGFIIKNLRSFLPHSRFLHLYHRHAYRNKILSIQLDSRIVVIIGISQPFIERYTRCQLCRDFWD